MFTYYMILNATGGAEGGAEVSGANNVNVMTKYLADWRYFTQKIGSSRALLHIEPDFWGFAQQVNSNPHAIPAAVASADPIDCTGYENSVAGLGQCMVHIVRAYAPNALIGLHASGWATGVDALFNTSTSLDVTKEAAKVAAFLAASGGAQTDFVVVEMSDRDVRSWRERTDRSQHRQRVPRFTHELLRQCRGHSRLPLRELSIPTGERHERAAQRQSCRRLHAASPRSLLIWTMGGSGPNGSTRVAAGLRRPRSAGLITERLGAHDVPGPKPLVT